MMHSSDEEIDNYVQLIDSVRSNRTELFSKIYLSSIVSLYEESEKKIKKNKILKSIFLIV